ncbi:salivary secreted ribonuclease-like protein [Dinothrombium tinctorium]|uniref:Salivary secreted ribonuclease-like protein n=1 Tax=Dinothrombium tinctorium TaxID=1965070 RepID=A0A3S4RAJ9_9ACAR|nr:salivary secreted ribonuclease-like protein [Dinothrombium tinctorium]RWS13777.1 salivary secreted ribonuclease-like protein [Dinothrombium tinctorium]
MIVCGKKLSICCSIISVWAILMLTLMGVLLYSHSVAFVDDLNLEDIQFETRDNFFTEAYTRYENAAHNCWIAVCIYIITLALSVHQYYLNRKLQYGL